MIATRLSNGNWKLRAEPDDLAPTQRESLLVLAIWEMVDCSLMGEEYCLSNYEMAADVYDYYTGKVIRLPYSQVDKLAEGPVTFYARDPEYNIGDWVEVGDCIPYEIISQDGDIFTLRSEEGLVKTATKDKLSPYID